MYSKKCGSFFETVKSKCQEIEALDKRYQQLPQNAKDDMLIPISVSAKAERGEAKKNR